MGNVLCVRPDTGRKRGAPGHLGSDKPGVVLAVSGSENLGFVSFRGSDPLEETLLETLPNVRFMVCKLERKKAMKAKRNRTQTP